MSECPKNKFKSYLAIVPLVCYISVFSGVPSALSVLPPEERCQDFQLPLAI